MKKTLVIALVAGLAACGDKPSISPVAQAAPPKAIAAAVEPVNDADKELAQRVMRAIGEAGLYGIDAEAVDGTVTLWGSAVSEKERARASDVAMRVEGVKAVESRLDIVTGS